MVVYLGRYLMYVQPDCDCNRKEGYEGDEKFKAVRFRKPAYQEGAPQSGHHKADRQGAFKTAAATQMVEFPGAQSR